LNVWKTIVASKRQKHLQQNLMLLKYELIKRRQRLLAE
jgi:hypothetical protein